MLRLFKRAKTPKPIPEDELIRRLTAQQGDAPCALALRPFGWADPPAPQPDSAIEDGGDVITESYARRGRDLLVRALMPIPIKGTDTHVFIGVWGNLSTGDFARFRSAQARGDADRLGDLGAWLYCRIPASNGPVLTRGVIVPVAGGALPIYWIGDQKHPLHDPQHGSGLTPQGIVALYEDLGAQDLVARLRA